MDYALQHHDYMTKCEPGTGQSLLVSKEVEDWLDQKKKTLFCSGIPGAGKTFQMSVLVSSLLYKFQENNAASVIFLYCNYQRQQEQKAEHLIANLIKQLCRNMNKSALPIQVQELYNQHKIMGIRPLIKELSEALISIVKSFSRVFIIIDALDECEDNDGSRTRLLDQLFSIQGKTDLNLFATSRPIPSIKKRFEGCLLREICPSRHDVLLFLDNHMSQLPSFVADDVDLQNEIKTSIESAIEGM